MIKLEIKNYNIVLKETQQKYQYYNPQKLANESILQVKKYYHLIKIE